jgi:hypothetical protein
VKRGEKERRRKRDEQERLKERPPLPPPLRLARFRGATPPSSRRDFDQIEESDGATVSAALIAAVVEDADACYKGEREARRMREIARQFFFSISDRPLVEAASLPPAAAPQGANQLPATARQQRNHRVASQSSENQLVPWLFG